MKCFFAKLTLMAILFAGALSGTPLNISDGPASAAETPTPNIAFLGDAHVNRPVSSLSLVQASATISPAFVQTRTSPSLDIAVSGFFDLSEVTSSQVSLQPNDGVSNLKILSTTAQKLKLTFDLSETAAPGNRILRITDKGGVTRVAVDLEVRLGDNVCLPACQPPKTCQTNHECKLPGSCLSHKDCNDGFECVDHHCKQKCQGPECTVEH